MVQASGQQMVEIIRRVTTTVPQDLTYEEAAAILGTRGIFPIFDAEWVKLRSTFNETKEYRFYTLCVEWFIILFVTPVLNGFTLSMLWQWFLVEEYDLPVLRLPVAIGVMIIVSLFTAMLKRTEEHDRNYREKFFRVVLNPLSKTVAFLSIGWFYHLFV